MAAEGTAGVGSPLGSFLTDGAGKPVAPLTDTGVHLETAEIRPEKTDLEGERGLVENLDIVLKGGSPAPWAPVDTAGAFVAVV